MKPLRVVYFGLAGPFSAAPLQALLDDKIVVEAVVLPARNGSATAGDDVAYRQLTRTSRSRTSGRRSLPLLGAAAGRNMLQIADERGIPVLEVARLHDPRTAKALTSLAPDAICVACFTHRIPAEILRIPRLGCLNVHPSLLPDNRGPDPLFWTFRRGDESTGITIHLMDEGLDTGPIVLQERVVVSEGITEAELERQCASVGGALLVRALRALDDGSVHPIAQDESRATRYAWPAECDFVITGERSAQWAYSFARGMLGRTEPIAVKAQGATLRLVEAIGYDTSAQLSTPFELTSDVLSLRCTPGIFYARVMLA